MQKDKEKEIIILIIMNITEKKEKKYSLHK